MEPIELTPFTTESVLLWFEQNNLEDARTWYHKGRQGILSMQDRGIECSNIVLQTLSVQKWIGLALAAIENRQRIWFVSPHWRCSEIDQIHEYISPDIVWSEFDYWSVTSSNSTDRRSTSEGIMIATGGSSGNIKFAWHSVDSLSKAVIGMSQFFYKRSPEVGDFQYNCDLPLWHVSGWMQVFRSFLTRSTFYVGSHYLGPSKKCKKERVWLSVVPTQFSKLLRDPEEPLKDYDYIVIGGASCPAPLLSEAVKLGVYPWVTYGMTETAGMIAGKQICSTGDFSTGARLFPHASIRIDEDESEIIIQSQSLCYGYNNLPFLEDERKWFHTKDTGSLSSEGLLHVRGRLSDVINSGGEKILPVEIESEILKHDRVVACKVFGKDDPYWGKKTVAVVQPKENQMIKEELLISFLKESLASYKIPKQWVFLERLPYDSKGKISIAKLQRIAEKS